MKILTKNQVTALQDQLIERFGGTHGIRDEGILDSALHAPFQTFAGEELYPGIYEKAARLGFGLVKGHAFIDGNKRAAVIFANHYLIAHANGLLVIPETNVPEFKRLLVDYYEGADEAIIMSFLKQKCWKTFQRCVIRPA